MTAEILWQTLTTAGLLIPIGSLIWNMSKLAAQTRSNSEDIAGLAAIRDEFIVLKSEHAAVLDELDELKRSQAAISNKLTQMEINLIRSNAELKAAIDVVIRKGGE